MSERVVIVGGSGHARVIAGILEEGGEFQIAAFVAPDAPAEIQGIPCLHEDGELPRLFASGIRLAFVAIGDNRRRRQCFEMTRCCGFELFNAISPRAVVSRRTELGRGIAIMPGSVVNTAAKIGDSAILNTNSCVEHDSCIGAFAHIAPGVSLAGKVRLEEGVLIGVGASVIPGITVGQWATIGAGSVVVRDIPAYATAWGIPARVQRYEAIED